MNALIIKEIIDIVSDFFDGDQTKVKLWFKSANPNFGGISPNELILLGCEQKVLDFAVDARDANHIE